MVEDPMQQQPPYQQPPHQQQGHYQGMPPQQMPQGQPQAQGPQRMSVHHSYIWLGTVYIALTMFVVLFFTMVPVILQEGASFGLGALGGLAMGLGLLGLFVLILGLVVLIQYLSYRNLYYELGEEEFNLYSGILNKKRVHVPYQRIQSVNQKATLMQRIFGVCTVNIDTAGGAANKAVTVPYLQNTAAEQLRYELFARKQAILSGGTAGQVASQPQAVPGEPLPAGYPYATQAPNNILDMPAEVMTDVRGVFGSQAIDTGTVTYQHGLSNKELVLTGLSNNTGFALMIVALLGTVASVAGQMLETAVGRWAYQSGMSIASQLIPTNTVWLVTGIVIVTLLGVWLVSTIGTCISYGGFKAMRRGNRIEVEHGLLQHRFQGVDIDRVQSVIIKQGFIRRIFGYCELSLGKIDALTEESSGQPQAQGLGLVVHPFVKLTRVPEILAGLVPEFADVPMEAKPVSKQALRRAIIRRCILLGNGFWLAVMVAIAHIVSTAVLPTLEGEYAAIEMYINAGALMLYALCLAIIILDAIGAVLWYRGSSFAYNKHFMQVTNGGFSRESVTFPRKKIQFGFTKTNPFQRMAGVKTINAQTAAGIGGTTMKLLDVYADEADTWLDWVKPRKNMVQ